MESEEQEELRKLKESVEALSSRVKRLESQLLSAGSGPAASQSASEPAKLLKEALKSELPEPAAKEEQASPEPVAKEKMQEPWFTSYQSVPSPEPAANEKTTEQASPQPAAKEKTPESEPAANKESTGSEPAPDQSTYAKNRKEKPPGDKPRAEFDSEPAEKQDGPSKSQSSSADNDESSSASLETRIGLYWLGRLGIGFLVFGIALLILYSFQYFGAWLKLATGFLLAAGLVGAGEFVDRKQKMSWYGNVLAGGGWSLAYFSSYAMGHVESVRVIQDPIIGSLLMLLVAGAAVAHSLIKNSELVATLAIFLGFMTLFLTDSGSFSGSASLILTAALAYLVHKCKWTNLYSVGVLSAYIFLLFSAELRKEALDLGLLMVYLLPYWLAANLLPLSFLEQTAASKRAAVAMSVLSAAASYFALKPALATLCPNADACIFSVAIPVYAVLALVLKRRDCPAASLVNGLISLSSATLLFPALNQGPTTLIDWSLQLGIVLFAGLTYNLRSFRWFAYPLSLLVFFSAFAEMNDHATFMLGTLTIPWSALNILPGVIVYLAAAAAYQGERFKNVIGAGLKEFTFYWYLHLGAVLSFILVPLTVYGQNSNFGPASMGLLLLGWSAQSLIVGLMALHWQRRYLCLLSLMGLSFTACTSLFNTGSAEPLAPTLAGIAMTFWLAFRSRQAPETMRPGILFGSYFVVASLWVFCFQAARLFSYPDWLVVALAAEMLVCIILGTRIKEVLIRTIGVLAGSLLFFALLFDSRLSWQGMIPSVAAIFAAGHLYRQLKFEDGLDNTRKIVRDFFNYGGTIALTNFIGWRAQSYYVSIGWAVEGLLLLSAGFVLADKGLRVLGLLVFGLLSGRLLLFDLSSAPTVYRIVAFIVAGLMFMLAAYAYSGFNKTSLSSKR